MLRDAELTVQQDWVSLAKYLADLGHQLDLEDAPRQFSGGVANLNYLITVDGLPAVLRRPPAGPLAEGANDLAREHKVMSALNPVLHLVPKPLLICEDTSVLGASFEVIEYRDGISVGAHLPPQHAADPTASARLTRGLVDTMARLHELDPESIGLGDLGKPEGFCARQVKGWGRRSDAVYPDGLPGAAKKIIDHLTGIEFVEPERFSLLHCDLKPDNMLVDRLTLAPVALIDWDMGTRGDPLFDLAVLLSYWVEPNDPEELRALKQVPSLELGAPTRRQITEWYAESRGIEFHQLAGHLVLARLRLAIAWMQLYRQWERGSLVDPRYEGFRAIAETVLDWTASQLSNPTL